MFSLAWSKSGKAKQCNSTWPLPVWTALRPSLLILLRRFVAVKISDEYDDGVIVGWGDISSGNTIPGMISIGTMQ